MHSSKSARYVLAGTLAFSSVACKKVDDLMREDASRPAARVVTRAPERQNIGAPLLEAPADRTPRAQRTVPSPTSEDASVRSTTPPAVTITTATSAAPFSCREYVPFARVLGANTASGDFSGPVIATLCTTPGDIRNIGALRCRQTNLDELANSSDAGTNSLPRVDCNHPVTQNQADNNYGRRFIEALYTAISGSAVPVGNLSAEQVNGTPLARAFTAFLGVLRSSGEIVAPTTPGDKLGLMERFVNFMIGAPYTCETIARAVAEGFNRRMCCESGTATTPCNTRRDLSIWIPRSVGITPSGITNLEPFGGADAFSAHASDFTLLTRDGRRYFMPDHSNDGGATMESYYVQRGFFCETYFDSSCTQRNNINGHVVIRACIGAHESYCDPAELAAVACNGPNGPRYQRKDMFIVLDAMAVISWRLRHVNETHQPYTAYLNRDNGVATEELPAWYRPIAQVGSE
ncbi:hypothetical protein HY990_06200 [Candidatus Micrarchaeota archaeon]|nr:hypothetical protein [Candidatus Micrarchaeota archaeon]